MKEPAEVAETLLIAHQRRDIGSCACGWGVDTGDLGRSHAAHVVDVLIAAGLISPRGAGNPQTKSSNSVDNGLWKRVGGG